MEKKVLLSDILINWFNCRDAYKAGTTNEEAEKVAEEMFKAYIQVFKIDIKIHSWRDLAEREDMMYQYIKSKK